MKAEQRLLESHDAVVFQHPFFWYSSPSRVKEWLDLVLEYHWACGEGGTALPGKILAHAISAGGSEDAYRRGGAERPETGMTWIGHCDSTFVRSC